VSGVWEMVFFLACLIHKLYIFQGLWIKQVNPDLENVKLSFFLKALQFLSRQDNSFFL